MRPTRAVKISSYVISILSIGLIILSGWMFIEPFDQIKPAIDSLAGDGEVESFTLTFYQYLKIILSLLDVFALSSVIMAIGFRERFFALLEGFYKWLSGIRALGRDAKTFFRDFFSSIPERADLISLLCLLVIGAVLRVLLSNLPMVYDESYTYMVFARHNLGQILRDYHLPNNHVFHTVLVHFSTRIFGPQPWAIRLPATVSILGMIPAGYLAARRYFNRRVGLLLAAAAAVMPNFILTSLNARGYPVAAFMLIILWGLALYLKEHNNLFAWFAFVITAVLGFFTQPVMLYGFGMILVWLFVSALDSDISDEYSHSGFVRSLVISGLAVVVLTVLLYSPIMINNSVGALLSPPVIQSIKAGTLTQLTKDFSFRMGSAWIEWHDGFGSWFAWVTLAGVIWALLRFRQLSRHKISALMVGTVWALAVVLIQMTVGPSRIWFFISPFYFAYAFAGCLDLLDLLAKKVFKFSQKWTSAAVIFLVLIAGSARWFIADSSFQDLIKGSEGYIEQAAEFIAANSNETDLIVVTFPDDPILWYYADNLGIETRRFHPGSRIEFDQALVVVNTDEGQTFQSVLAAKSLLSPPAEMIDLIYESPPLQIYRIPIISPEP